MLVKMRFSLVLLVCVNTAMVNSHTFEEFQSWQDMLDEEAVEILPPENIEESPTTSPMDDKDNRASPLRFQAAECRIPPNFPVGLGLGMEDYTNWAEDLRVANMWTVQPRSAKDVVTLANWAYIYGYKLRAKGHGSSWAPLTITMNAKCSNTILVDTTKFLTSMRMIASKSNSNFRAVHVQTGTSMENLMGYLEHNNAALYAAPIMGEATVGGILATGGHGYGLNRMGTRMPIGHSAGSLSNLILSFKAIVWDHESQSYILKKFTREHEDSRAFLTHIGRAFITDVRLMVGPSYNMRCESNFDYSAERLLARPTHYLRDEDSLAGLVEKFNSVDVAVYPYSDNMWVLSCTNSTRLQDGSKFVGQPYAFSASSYAESVPRPVSMMMTRFLSGFHYLSPLISKMEYKMDMMKVKYDRNQDIWGPSNSLWLRYKKTFRRSVSSGYAILTTRERVQKIVSDFYSFYTSLVTKFSSEWKFPQNEPLQISIAGLDNPADVPGLGQFDPPALSFLAPLKGTDFDTAIFVALNAIPGTPYFESFMRQVESYLFLKYDGTDAVVRPEWSKAWGFTDTAAWDNNIMLKRVIPSTFGEDWSWALSRFDYYDPYQVFSNDFLDSFMKANNTLKHKMRLK